MSCFENYYVTMKMSDVAYLFVTRKMFFHTSPEGGRVCALFTNMTFSLTTKQNISKYLIHLPMSVLPRESV